MIILNEKLEDIVCQDSRWVMIKTPKNSQTYTIYDKDNYLRSCEVPRLTFDKCHTLGLKFFNPLEWKQEDFHIGPMLGKGSYGKIYMALEIKNQILVALKYQDNGKLKKQKRYKNMSKEFEIQTHLDHPHILKMYGFFSTKTSAVSILELAQRGSLKREMKKRKEGRFRQKVVAKILHQLISALIYLHSKDIVHRDIKSDNILLDEEGNIKLADFGFATKLDDYDGKRGSRVGTNNYMPPQIIESQDYDQRADVWSMGVLTFQLCSGKLPFYSRYVSVMDDKITSIDYKFPDYFSLELRDFIWRILMKRQDERMTLEEALEHPWMVRKYSEKTKV